MIRRIAREMALQSLFEVDILESVRTSLPEAEGIDYTDFTVEAALGAAFAQHEEEEALKAQDFAETLVRGVLAHREELDAKLQQYSKDWSIERMPAADRSILRIAAYELFFAKHVQQPAVAINEAVELSKLYGTDDSPRFVNGVLGKLVEK